MGCTEFICNQGVRKFKKPTTKLVELDSRVFPPPTPPAFLLSCNQESSLPFRPGSLCLT